MWRALIFALVAIVVSGCVTPGKFKALNERVKVLEKAAKKQSEDLTRQDARLENINALFKKSKANLHKSSADTEANLDEVANHARRNQGQIEETRFTVDRHKSVLEQVVKLLDRKFGVTISELPKDIPQKPEELFDLAIKALSAKRYREGRALFQRYLAEHRDKERGPDAQFYIGESYIAENDNDSALHAFKAVHSDFPKSERMPEALLRIGDILAKTGQCSKAKQVYQLLKREAKSSPQAPLAKERIAELKKTCKP